MYRTQRILWLLLVVLLGNSYGSEDISVQCEQLVRLDKAKVETKIELQAREHSTATNVCIILVEVNVSE